MEESLRQFVWLRAQDRCEYCGLQQEQLPWATFQVDHIRAKQHRGGDDPSNLALARHRCNAYKRPNLTSYDPISDLLVPLFNPREDEWDEHFIVREFAIIGKTPIGRATSVFLT